MIISRHIVLASIPILLFLSHLCSAQASRTNLSVVRLDDSTYCVDVKQYAIKVVFPRPDSAEHDLQLIRFDGLPQLFIPITGIEVRILFDTHSNIKRSHDIVMRRMHSADYQGSDALDPETPAEFDTSRADFQKDFARLPNDEYLTIGNRKYLIRSTYSELMGVAIGYVTFLGDLRLTVRMHFYDSPTIEHLLQIGRVAETENANNYRKARELASQRSHTYLVSRTLPIIRRMRFEKTR